MNTKLDTLKASCTFSGFSAAGNAAIGVCIANDDIPVEHADHFLCDSQCEVTLTAERKSDDDVPGQARLHQDDGPDTVTAVADIPSFRRTSKQTTFRLAFNIEELGDALDAIMSMRNRNGRIELIRLGDIQRKGRGVKGDDDGDEDGDE